MNTNPLLQKGSYFLGSQYPLMGGAMSWLSNATLTAAISNAGAFGVIASGAMTPDLLQLEIEKTKQKTNKTFGVNLITMHPLIMEMIDVCDDISHIIFAGGIPSQTMIEAAKNKGSKVIGFAPALSMAKRLVRLGVDAIIIEGSEAGGHIGPVSTSVLAQEILPFIAEVPIFVAGGIGTGEGIATYLRMGASGCQLGTRFVCSFESPAHPDFKKAFIRAKAKDAVVSTQLDHRFPVIPVRSLGNEALKEFLDIQKKTIQRYDNQELNLKEAQLEIEHFWAGALKRAALEGDIKNGSLMAGQSVGFVEKEESCQEIIQGLIQRTCDILDEK